MLRSRYGAIVRFVSSTSDKIQQNEREQQRGQEDEKTITGLESN